MTKTFWQRRRSVALILSVGALLIGCGGDGAAETSAAAGSSSAGAPQAGGGVETTGGNASGGGGTGNPNGGAGSGGAAPTARGCKRGLAWPGKKLDHPELNAKLPWW